MGTTLAELDLHPLAKELLRLLLVDPTSDRRRLYRALEERLARLDRERYGEAATDVLWVARYLEERGDPDACKAMTKAVRGATRRVAARDGLLPLLDGATPPSELTTGERHLPTPRASPTRVAPPSPINAFETELDLDRLRRLAAQSAWMKSGE
ncbi:MAG: hypothetical protein IPG45_29340 [Deltaproteobacteria bacterium]|nr:hypothetical protein [Deltaproteobacteria bacterium]